MYREGWVALEMQQSCHIFSARRLDIKSLDSTLIEGSYTPMWGGGGGILMPSLLMGEAGGVKGCTDRLPLGGLVAAMLVVTNWGFLAIRSASVSAVTST